MSEIKPSKSHKVSNMRHKKCCLEQFYLLNQSPFNYDRYLNVIDKFNFKKTNAKKYSYSCGGYGGKCSMCKNTYGAPKKYRKQTINCSGFIVNMKIKDNFN